MPVVSGIFMPKSSKSVNPF